MQNGAPTATMKFTLDQGELFVPLKHLQGVVEPRGTVPILSNVLVTARDGAIEFAATDLDLYVIERLSGNIEEEGSVTVSARVLHEIVGKIPGDKKVNVETGKKQADGESEAAAQPSSLLPMAAEGHLLIEAGPSQFALSTLSPEEFPAFGGDELGGNFKIGAEELRRLFRRAAFAMSVDEMRSHLNGIFLHAAKEGDAGLLRAAATDGHRLARIETDLPDGAQKLEDGVIVPSKTVAEIMRLLEDFEETVDFAFESNQLRLGIGGVTLVSRLLDGVFPDYQRVIPEGNDNALVLPKTAFGDAVDRVAVLTDEKTRALRLDIDGNQLVVSAQDPSRGGARESLEVKFKGERLTIGFNADYLLELCRTAVGDEITMQVGDARSAVSVTDSGDERALFVLMPLRV